MPFRDDWRRLPLDLLAIAIFNAPFTLIYLFLPARSILLFIVWAVVPAILISIVIQRENANHPDFPDKWPARIVTPYGVILGITQISLVSIIWVFSQQLVALIS